MQTIDPQEPERGARQSDEALRRDLAPDDATVHRIVRHALTPRPRRAQRSRRVWVPLVATAVALLALALAPLLRMTSSEIPAPQTAIVPKATTLPVAPQTAVLTISNAEGFVTITAADGSKTIMLPGGTS